MCVTQCMISRIGVVGPRTRHPFDRPSADVGVEPPACQGTEQAALTCPRIELLRQRPSVGGGDADRVGQRVAVFQCRAGRAGGSGGVGASIATQFRFDQAPARRATCNDGPCGGVGQGRVVDQTEGGEFVRDPLCNRARRAAWTSLLTTCPRLSAPACEAADCGATSGIDGHRVEQRIREVR